jgi:hypothetical protein
MNDSGAASLGDFRDFLRSAPDFDELELTRARDQARTVELDPLADGAKADGGEPE